MKGRCFENCETGWVGDHNDSPAGGLLMQECWDQLSCCRDLVSGLQASWAQVLLSYLDWGESSRGGNREGVLGWTASQGKIPARGSLIHSDTFLHFDKSLRNKHKLTTSSQYDVIFAYLQKTIWIYQGQRLVITHTLCATLRNRSMWHKKHFYHFKIKYYLKQCKFKI